MIYLDCNATTALADEVLEEMLGCIKQPSNASSIHSFGREAKEKLLRAKTYFSSALGAQPEEIIFTSGGTESMNSLIKGLYSQKGKILTTDIEHPCILETLKSMNLPKDHVIYLSPGTSGTPNPLDVEKALSDDITLMIFSAVYSETGVKSDIERLSKLAYERQIPLIIDAVAILGKEPFKILPGMTGVGFSAHKLHGPAGIGAMYIDKTTSFKPLLYGGGQQLGKRPGTENIAAIIGFKKALELSLDSLSDSKKHMKELQSFFLSELADKGVNFEINGDDQKVCNTLNLSFKHISGETLLIHLDQNGLAASLGSACSAGALQPSQVLLNMGYELNRVKSSLRFSWSRYTKKSDIKKATSLIAEIVSLATTC